MKRFQPLVCLVVLLVGCGGGGGSNSTPTPTPQAAVVTGQWSFIATDTTNNKTAVFANLSSQGGGSYFATGVDSAVCDLATSQCQVINNTPSITVTVSLTNQVQVSMTNVVTTTGATITVSGTGTVDAAGTKMSSGTWTSSGGASGTWTSDIVKSFTGSYTGTFNSTVSPATVPYGVSLTIAQDTSYNVTGTAVITHSLCFTNLTLSGHAVGGVFYLVDSAQSIVAVGIEGPALPPNQLAFGYQVVSGCGAGDVGQGTITRQ